MESKKYPKELIDWCLIFLSKKFLKFGEAVQGSCLPPILFNTYTKRLH